MFWNNWWYSKYFKELNPALMTDYSLYWNKGLFIPPLSQPRLLLLQTLHFTLRLQHQESANQWRSFGGGISLSPTPNAHSLVLKDETLPGLETMEAGLSPALPMFCLLSTLGISLTRLNDTVPVRSAYQALGRVFACHRLKSDYRQNAWPVFAKLWGAFLRVTDLSRTIGRMPGQFLHGKNWPTDSRQ